VLTVLAPFTDTSDVCGHTNRYYNVLLAVLIVYMSLSGWVAAESVAVTDWVLDTTSLIPLLVNGFLIGLLTVSQMLAQPFGKVIARCDSENGRASVVRYSMPGV
jgi:hypothetical protein